MNRNRGISRSIPRIILVLAAFSLLAPASASAQESWAVAKQVQENLDLVKGPASDGAIGDYLLANDRIRVIIDAPDRPHGFAGSGGNILDADAVRRGPPQDEIKQVFTYFQNRFGAQALYRTLDIMAPGDHEQAASIRVIGIYSADENVRIETIYTLAPAANHVHIKTTLVNGGSNNYPEFALGDAIEWGETRAFLPGPGYQLRGATPQVSWIGGQGNQTSYGWTVKRGRMESTHGSGWSDLVVAKPPLPPGGQISYERFFFVGLGDLSTVVQPMTEFRSERTGLLTGVAREAESGQALAGMEIEAASANNQLAMVGLTDLQGRFRLILPPGAYQVDGHGPGRGPFQKSTASVKAGESATTVVTLTLEGRIRYTITDDKGALIPGKLTLIGVGETRTPYLGPPHHAKGALNTLFSPDGHGEGLVPPGDYEVIVTRGPEYNALRKNITIAGGKMLDFSANLLRAVDTRGWISADLHTHTRNSYDCRVSIQDRLTSLAAEHIEFAVASDHDFVTDYTPAIQSLGVSNFIKGCAGVEVSTNSLGHFNVFPLPLRNDRPGNGALGHANKTVREIYTAAGLLPGARIFQVNHPRANSVGYFNACELDLQKNKAPQDFFWSFDTLEVWNGKHLADVEKNLLEWYEFFRRGFRPIATGGSDSHQVVNQEAGYPRTYIASRDDEPGHLQESEIIAALKGGHAFVTNGPFVSMEMNGSGRIGDMLRVAPGSEIQLRIKVQAADWIDVSEVALVESGQTIQTLPVPPSTGAVRYEGLLKRKPAGDAWYLIIVRGRKSLAPMVAESGGPPFTPFAFTNPIWVDTDGNGRYNPPGAATGILTPAVR